MSRGDIAWLELPEEGRRPVCVLTRDAAIPALRNVVVALVTRTVRGIPTEVRLGAAEGLPEPCVVSLDSLRTVPKALLTERAGALSPAKHREVCAALAHATGCA